MSGKNSYQPIIGAEIHVGLGTNSGMFCGCKNDRSGNAKPNTLTCPVCLGLPGALPIPNNKAIDYTIMVGLALNCQIADVSVFDRKHYFYPDLPKGYQISQQAKPLCTDGYVETSFGKVKINRVHLEEDAGKLIHSKIDGKKVSLIDFNRSGLPLVEIVTEPDMHSAKNAKEFLKKIRQLIRYLGVSDADMEKGSMRLEANISLSPDGNLPNYKVEVKNINSFNFYSRAIKYEIKRQTEILNKGETPVQETRGWDQATNTTVPQRTKESAGQYGYFADPDIPPLDITSERLDRVRQSIPPLPAEYIDKLVKLKVRRDLAIQLVKTRDHADYALTALAGNQDESIAKEIANRIINNKLDITKIKASDLIKMLEEEQSSQISDKDQLQQIINEVISSNQQVAEDYKSGKVEALGFLVGQVMKATQGKANAKKASDLLRQSLSK